MSDIQRYAPERMLVLYDDHAKIVANLRAINEAGDEVINTQAADIRRLESQITRLESRLAAAEKLRAGVGEVILRQPAHNNEVGYFNVHLDEFGEEHVEQVDPGAVLGSTVACLMEIVAAYDAAKEPKP